MSVPRIFRHAKEKHIVSQTRMLWTFSLSHRLGYSTMKLDYLKAAELGYRFLIDFMLDKQYGGVYWNVDPIGQILDNRKFLFGQAYAIYALIEFHRACGSKEALTQAISIFRTVQRELHDERNLGWREHGEADFAPVPVPSEIDRRKFVDVVGLKSRYTHMHWMEALSELYEVTRDDSVRAALLEVLKTNTNYFFLPEPTRGCEFRNPNWTNAPIESETGFHAGYNLEFAWLMIRAQQALGVPPGWDHFEALLTYSLESCFDWQMGGIGLKGQFSAGTFDGEKVWWVQAEGLAALSEALEHQPNSFYEKSLVLLLNWIWRYQRLRDGVWVTTTDASGKIIDRTKAKTWKDPYHDVRGMIKFLQAFSPLQDT